jgi:hypothetical protein
MTSDERDREDALLWRQHVARNTPPDQPKPYSARLFEGPHRLGSTNHMVVLDLTPGPGLEEAHRRLESLLKSLIAREGVKPDRHRACSLEVRHWHNDELVFLWSPTWPTPER